MTSTASTPVNTSTTDTESAVELAFPVWNAALAGDTAPYVAASVATKSAVRNHLQSAANTAMTEGDFEKATAMITALNSVKGARATSSPKSIDYTALLATRIRTLRNLAELAHNQLPLDVEIDQDRLAELLADESDSTMDGQLIKLVEGRKITGGKAAGSNLQADLDSFVESASVTAGTVFTVAQLSKNVTSGDGAIAARLFPASGTCTLNGWEPVAATSTQARGARYTG